MESLGKHRIQALSVTYEWAARDLIYFFMFFIFFIFSDIGVVTCSSEEKSAFPRYHDWRAQTMVELASDPGILDLEFRDPRLQPPPCRRFELSSQPPE